MKYYCSETVISSVKLHTHYTFFSMVTSFGDLPQGFVLITDEFTSCILLAESDLLPTSEPIVYDEQYQIVDLIENGCIPDELDPVPGTRIYSISNSKQFC